MKFTDYEASFITPQMTLLEKFNAVLKFLEENDKTYTQLYTHKITLNDMTIIRIVNNRDTQMNIFTTEMIGNINNALNATVDNYSCFHAKYSGHIELLYINNSNLIVSKSLYGLSIQSYEIEKYTGR